MRKLSVTVLMILFFAKVSYSQKIVALTFDDGPDSSYTEKLLDILKSEHVPATFFVLGYKVKKYPGILKRIYEEGHLIGNHSTAHKNFTEYKDTALVLQDVHYVDSLVKVLTGKKIKYFRPPYGALRDDQIKLLERHGYDIAMWTLSVKDWDVFHTTKQNIIDSVKRHIHDNAIILMHSKDASGKLSDYPLRNNTIEALPEVIKFLKQKGYHFVTFDEINRSGDRATLEKPLRERTDIIFYGGFEENFGDVMWQNKWGIAWQLGLERAKVAKGGFDGGKCLRVEYPRGEIGPWKSGAQFPIVFAKMPGKHKDYFQEAYLRYYVKFEKGFDFKRGGKLPGLMGGGDSWTRSGGNQPNGLNGWTLRLMWLENGKAIIYAYVPKSANGKWGGKKWGERIDCKINFLPDKWYRIEEYVNVGSPGKDNGKLKVWINGKKLIDINDMRFRDVNNKYGKIGGVYFSTFFGGNTPDWAPMKTSYADFDGFVVSEKRPDLK